MIIALASRVIQPLAVTPASIVTVRKRTSDGRTFASADRAILKHAEDPSKANRRFVFRRYSCVR